MWFFSILDRDNTLPRTVIFTPVLDLNPVPSPLPETDKEIAAIKKEWDKKLTLYNHDFWTEKVRIDKNYFYFPTRVIKPITIADFDFECDRITQLRKPRILKDGSKLWLRSGETFSPENTIEISRIQCGFIEAVYFTDEIPEKVSLINSAGIQTEYTIDTDGERYLFLGMYPTHICFSQYSNLYLKFDRPYNFSIIYQVYGGPTGDMVELLRQNTFKWGKYNQRKYFWYNSDGVVCLGIDEDDDYNCYKRPTQEGWVNVFD